MRETFKRKPTNVGSSVGITIPTYLVRSGKVKKGEEYNITISDEDEQNGGLQ